MKNTGNNKTKSAVKSDNSEIEKAKSHIIVEITEYIPNSVVSKTIIKKLTGNVSVMSFDTGEGLSEKTSPFDTFVQIIEGKANIVINKSSATNEPVEEQLKGKAITIVLDTLLITIFALPSITCTKVSKGDIFSDNPSPLSKDITVTLPVDFLMIVLLTTELGIYSIISTTM